VAAFTGARLAYVADTDPAVSRLLAVRFPGIPNIGDVRAAIPPAEILCTGFPCQPVSQAGAKAGVDDERWIFNGITAAISRMGALPRLLVFENVTGLLSANRGHAMARVIHGLAALGYVGRYRVLRAADAGAPHRRERVFIVAYPADAPFWARDDRQCGNSGEPPLVWGQAAFNFGRSGGCAADTERPRLQGGTGGGVTGTRRPPILPSGECGFAADSGGPGFGFFPGFLPRPQGAAYGDITGDFGGERDDYWGAYAPAITRWEHILGRPSPRPVDPAPRGGHALSPRFTEWMMGLPDGWVTASGVSRRAQLAILGNGVVPQQAYLALRLLLGGVP